MNEAKYIFNNKITQKVKYLCITYLYLVNNKTNLMFVFYVSFTDKEH